MSRASQYQRFGTTTAAPGTLAYYLEQTGGNVQQARAELDAKNAGFASATDMTINRGVRNQLETKATAAGMSLEEAYALVPGGDLTNTAALQQAWNQIPTTPVAKQEATTTEDTTTKVEPTEKSKEYTSDADKILAGIKDVVAAIPDYSADIKQLREDMAASQRTLASNLAISKRTPNLQIQPASGTPTTGGTQGFRRRQSQFMPGGAGSVLAGLNLGQPSMMNV